MNVLVTGFGSFPGVPRNPTEELAIAVDGARVGRLAVVGRVLPVSYLRGPDTAIRLALEHRAELVIGTGVAIARRAVSVERFGRRVDRGPVDVDGASAPGLEGPELVPASVDVLRLAGALGAELSDDAGAYVCNAWLYRVATALPAPVGFVHVPAEGLAPSRLLEALAALAAG